MSESGPNPSETGQKTASLKEQLAAFAAIEDEAARGQKLVEVANFLANEADKDTMDNLVSPEASFQGKLAEAVTATLATPIKLNDDAEPVEGWRGHGTAVALASDGEVIGTFNKPTGLEGEPANYGDLRRYALIKAMSSLHLEKAGKEGGMLGNYDYLTGLGLTPYETLFTGDAEKAIEVDGKKVYVATSGIEAREEFIGKHLKADLLLPEEPKVGRETRAGFFDGIASNRIARNLVHPELARDPIVIPPNEMSRNN